MQRSDLAHPVQNEPLGDLRMMAVQRRENIIASAMPTLWKGHHLSLPLVHRSDGSISSIVATAFECPDATIATLVQQDGDIRESPPPNMGRSSLRLAGYLHESDNHTHDIGNDETRQNITTLSLWFVVAPTFSKLSQTASAGSLSSRLIPSMRRECRFVAVVTESKSETFKRETI